MELRQLRYFATVADELHFGRAAQKLHMSQPPLSVQVGRLEKELGVALFERTTRRVALTQAGEHLKSRVADVFAQLDSVVSEMQDYADGLTGQLTVGFVSSANYTVLPGVVRRFRTHRPGVILGLVPLTSGEQIQRLLDGSIDVGIVRDDGEAAEHRDMITAEAVFEENLVACLSTDHELARRSEVTPREISQVPMISYPRSLMPGYVDRIESFLGQCGAVADVVEEVVHQETALGFVADGVGASILPESVRHMAPPSIAVVPLAGAPTSRLLMVRPVHAEHTALVDAFVECLRSAVGKV